MIAPGLILAPAVAADVPDLLLLIKALAEYEKLSHLVVADAADLHGALFGVRPAAEALIVREVGGKSSAIAFALFFTNFSTFLGRRGLWLEDLFVLPEYRGRGIGRALLEALADVARQRHYGRFEWAVLDWNAPAIGFYERMGATILTDWQIARVTGAALANFGAADAPTRE
ncbi:MAG: GNAT family N-acetyltransferase [Betaproteobacteria bacterium]